MDGGLEILVYDLPVPSVVISVADYIILQIMSADVIRNDGL